MRTFVEVLCVLLCCYLGTESGKPSVSLDNEICNCVSQTMTMRMGFKLA